MPDNYAKATNWMSREEVVDLLEQYGFACYDHEDTEDLRNTLAEEVRGGEIPSYEIEMYI